MNRIASWLYRGWQDAFEALQHRLDGLLAPLPIDLDGEKMEYSDLSGILPIPLAVNFIPPEEYTGDSIDGGSGDIISGTSITRVEGS